MKITTSLVAFAVAAAALTGTTSTAYAVETCFGLTPTIVTTPGEGEVSGTEGEDVIVDNHGRTILSLGGNDAICSVGSGYIEAGDGDDRVNLIDGEKGNLTFLGNGSDVYVGSAADDRVATGSHDGTDMLGGLPGDIDTISTLGGDDRVHSLAFHRPSADQIDLGTGDDSVRMVSGEGGSFVVNGGAGEDDVNFEMDGVKADLVVDLKAGTADIGTPAGAGMTGFENAGASGGPGTFTLRGTDGDNELYADSADARVFGLDGDDDLHVSGCGAVGRGNGGADRLESSGCRTQPIPLFGGAGNDELRGRKGPDVLIGNAGRDTARGGKGRDRCQAEVKAGCER